MTCIIGIETPEGAVLLGDRAVTINTLVLTGATPKIAEHNGLAFGGAGGVTASTALRDIVTRPDMTFDRLPAALRTELAERDAIERDHEGKASMDAAFVMLHQGAVYLLCNDFTVSRYANGFVAIGSGALIAIGALAAMPKCKTIKDAIRRGKRAMKVAAKYMEGVRPPFDIIIQR